jgi:hypothetical protein
MDFGTAKEAQNYMHQMRNQHRLKANKKALPDALQRQINALTLRIGFMKPGQTRKSLEKNLIALSKQKSNQ